MTTWSVEGLAARLDGFALGPVDLRLTPGRAVAVLGSSGAGKTTLLRTIAGFVPALAGRITRDGVDLTLRPPEARGLGYVPQGLGLFPHLTVERNVSYPLEVRGLVDPVGRTRGLLERFGLAKLAKRRPARLSGGELERVALARALAAEPELVLWDEPWQGLDVGARHDLDLVFQELRETERVPVVVVTHDPSLAFSVADSFLVLREGRARRFDDAAALIAAPGDAFTARFAGFENVFDRAALTGADAGALAAWLLGRAGPEGVAFARPLVGGSGTWEGVVRLARPTPEGIALTARVGGLSIALRRAVPLEPPGPKIGDHVRFDVDEKSVRALGG